jgi:acyl phosphate:glycerol-3-phosphate acyltransferase
MADEISAWANDPESPEKANCMLADQLKSVGGFETCAGMLAAYVLGCLTTGYYLVRLRTGQDIRILCSGSVGARNVGRILGKSGFLITLAGDFGKGALVVWAMRHFSGSEGLAALALLAVMCGHIWPVQLRFRGGKGVATSLGGLLLWDWRLAAAYAVIFGLLFAVLRRSTLAGLTAYAGLPLAGYAMNRDPLEALLLVVLGALVLFAHRNNLADEKPYGEARRSGTPGINKPNL